MLTTARALLLAGLFALSACVSGSEAPRDATLSNAPSAPGFLVIGISEENAVFELGRTTASLALSFQREGGGTAVMVRAGCGSMQGFYGSRPCDLTKPDWRVLQVAPGEWHASAVAEETKVLFGSKLLRDQLPPSAPIHVGPGEIVYAGDYVLTADYKAQEITVRRHGRDDAAAERAVATYPNLRGQRMVYCGSATTAGAEAAHMP